jgi:hypothetical protein
MVEDNEEDSSAVIRQAKGFEASGRAGGAKISNVEHAVAHETAQPRLMATAPKVTMPTSCILWPGTCDQIAMMTSFLPNTQVLFSTS